MMKKWIVLFLCLFLVACSDGAKTAKSPEEALQLLQSDQKFVSITKILTSTEISEDEIVYVFEGSNNRESEWYVAYLQKNNVDEWFVVEAFNIGVPSSSNYINYSGGNTFRAGIRSDGDLMEDGAIIVPIPNSKYFVQIEFIS